MSCEKLQTAAKVWECEKKRGLRPGRSASMPNLTKSIAALVKFVNHDAAFAFYTKKAWRGSGFAKECTFCRNALDVFAQNG
jgi:hypothetical protein